MAAISGRPLRSMTAAAIASANAAEVCVSRVIRTPSPG